MTDLKSLNLSLNMFLKTRIIFSKNIILKIFKISYKIYFSIFKNNYLFILMITKDIKLNMNYCFICFLVGRGINMKHNNRVEKFKQIVKCGYSIFVEQHYYMDPVTQYSTVRSSIFKEKIRYFHKYSLREIIFNHL